MGFAFRPGPALLAAALLALGLPARAEDEWFGGDKRAHFSGGVFVAGAFSAATGSHHPGVLMGCGVGVFGELIEAARDRGFTARASAKDFAAECAGGLLGAWVGVKLASDDRVAASEAARSSTDSWISTDKRAHFLGGVAVSGLIAHASDSATAGVLVGCGVALGGELADAARHGWHSKHVSAKDFAAGCAGAVVSAFASVQLAPNRIVWSRQF